MQFIAFIASIAVVIAGVSAQGVVAPVTYTTTFTNASGATQANDYITFSLVDNVTECIAFCNSVSGCGFFNIYNDVNGKDGSTKFTCSLYASCHNVDTATNTGGQSQPDGTINFIANSDGYCPGPVL